jgi:hypothetical protein
MLCGPTRVSRSFCAVSASLRSRCSARAKRIFGLPQTMFQFLNKLRKPCRSRGIRCCPRQSAAQIELLFELLSVALLIHDGTPLATSDGTARSKRSPVVQIYSRDSGEPFVAGRRPRLRLETSAVAVPAIPISAAVPATTSSPSCPGLVIIPFAVGISWIPVLAIGYLRGTARA